MLSIQKIFGRDGKFYDLLEKSAEEADASVHHLIALLERLEQHESPQSLEQFILSRRKDKEITQELTEQLCKTFITPFEREDIQALAGALYKIPKTVEKIGERGRQTRARPVARSIPGRLQNEASDFSARSVRVNRKGD
jgi:uncharacterized protein Yka (UPF0111/DUF47 family)